MKPKPKDVQRQRTFNPRIAAVAAHDIFMAGLAFELAVWLRYLTYGKPQDFFFLWHGTLIFIAVCAIVFWRMGLYRGIWHYASMADLSAIMKAVTLALLVYLPVMFTLDRLAHFPRSAMLITWPLLIVLLSGPRILYRLMKDGDLSAVFQRVDVSRVPVLLVGAGDEAETFIREMERTSMGGYRAVGIIDHKASRIGRDIRGVRVLGGLADVEEVLERLSEKDHRPQRLVIATGKLDGAEVGELLDIADRQGLVLSRMPKVTDFRGSSGNEPMQMRAIDVEDLLGRPQRVLDRTAIENLVTGKRVLVTGAGGTIGSELVRQIAALEPAELCLLDNGEYALYRIDLEVSESWPELRRQAVLGDVRDRARIDGVFERLRPELVFHAAAFKHVPMVEANPNEGVLTNVLGSANVAEACAAAGVDTMVLISTDKAVNPTNVMGASKRIAEMICQSLNLSGAATRFVTVRFGNVLGSTGSVVPLFQRQLERGGPLTVTHEDITRYFMTTREAVELVLQAAAQRSGEDLGGRIHVLDMGEPVKIVDLARQMIRLAGLRPQEDIDIAFTGLRPGEKLYEELLHDGENAVATEIEGVLLATPRSVDYAELKAAIERLGQAAGARQTEAVMALVADLVPEYQGDSPVRSEIAPSQPVARSGVAEAGSDD